MTRFALPCWLCLVLTIAAGIVFTLAPVSALASEFRVHGPDRTGPSSFDRLQTRLERNRIRSELNSLRREQVRLRSDRGASERFGPAPAAARDGRRRAIDSRLSRLNRETIRQRGRLGQLERRLADQSDPRGRRVPNDFRQRPSVPLLPSAALLGLPAQDRDGASEAARAIVNQLLRANEARETGSD